MGKITVQDHPRQRVSKILSEKQVEKQKGLEAWFLW
jgi:hypothetical protein